VQTAQLGYRYRMYPTFDVCTEYELASVLLAVPAPMQVHRCKSTDASAPMQEHSDFFECSGSKDNGQEWPANTGGITDPDIALAAGSTKKCRWMPGHGRPWSLEGGLQAGLAITGGGSSPPPAAARARPVPDHPRHQAASTAPRWLVAVRSRPRTSFYREAGPKTRVNTGHRGRRPTGGYGAKRKKVLMAGRTPHTSRSPHVCCERALKSAGKRNTHG
jgi:hypothetical protein